MNAEERRADPADRDLEATVEAARSELREPELQRTMELAEGEADRAAGRELLRWLFWLALGAALVAGVVHEVRFLLVAFLLALFYAVPYVGAAVSTARRERERRELMRALEERQKRGASPA